MTVGGIVLALAGVVVIVLDVPGFGDTARVDLKDTAIVAVGAILTGIGVATARRKSASRRSTSST